MKNADGNRKNYLNKHLLLFEILTQSLVYIWFRYDNGNAFLKKINKV